MQGHPARRSPRFTPNATPTPPLQIPPRRRQPRASKDPANLPRNIALQILARAIRNTKPLIARVLFTKRPNPNTGELENRVSALTLRNSLHVPIFQNGIHRHPGNVTNHPVGNINAVKNALVQLLTQPQLSGDLIGGYYHGLEVKRRANGTYDIYARNYVVPRNTRKMGCSKISNNFASKRAECQKNMLRVSKKWKDLLEETRRRTTGHP